MAESEPGVWMQRISKALVESRRHYERAGWWERRHRGLEPVLWTFVVTNLVCVLLDLIPDYRLGLSATAMVLAITGVLIVWRGYTNMRKMVRILDEVRVMMDHWYRAKYNREPPERWVEDGPEFRID
jgi:hypothetical protein